MKKPMVYQKDRKIELLDSGNYNGYNYAIFSYGTHPCAYVEIPKDNPCYKLKEDKLEDLISCHWGITYYRNFNSKGKEHSPHIYDVFGKAKVIGWDYAHCYDYAGYYAEENNPYFESLKKWTTEEIFEEVVDVIRRLKEAV